MTSTRPLSVLEQLRPRLLEILEEADLLEEQVLVLGKPLTPEEAIGTPGRRDFPILVGRERILEATVGRGRGHAFTDAPREFTGTLAQVMALELTSNQNRAIYIATLNAALAHLGLARGTLHCKDDDPERCGARIAAELLEQHGRVTVGLIGLNPALADHLVQAFGPEGVRICDLNPDNIGTTRFGVEVWAGEARTRDLIDQADVVILTGTTLQNGTFDTIWDTIQARGKRGIVFGVTGAGVCALAGIERRCPHGRDA